MAFIVAALPYITAAVGAVGAIQQGQQARATADYNARQEQIGADVTRRQAAAREELQRKEARKFLGRQRAAIAESGTGFGGSARDIAVDSALDAELDALNIRYQGELEARGLSEQAKLTRLEGRQRAGQYGLKAFGSVLGGIAQGYGK